MRHVDDGFVRIFRARQFRHHVARLRLFDVAAQIRVEARVGQHHRPETAAAGGGAQFFQVEPGFGEQLVRALGGEPALCRQARRRIVGRRQVVLHAAPAVAHHVPAVSGAGGVVDDERGGGALARGFLELVGPAPVISHAPAFEQRGVAVVEARIVDQHHHRLAAHVEAGVIVPAGFRRVHAVADEHHLAVAHAHFAQAAACAGNGIGAEAQLAAAAAHAQRQPAGGGIHFRRHHGHGLEITVAVAGLQAEALELLAQVLHGFFLAHGARFAAGEFVGGQNLYVRGEILGGDFRAKAVPGLLVHRHHRGFGLDDARMAAAGEGQRQGQPGQETHVHDSGGNRAILAKRRGRCLPAPSSSRGERPVAQRPRPRRLYCAAINRGVRAGCRYSSARWRR